MVTATQQINFWCRSMRRRQRASPTIALCAQKNSVLARWGGIAYDKTASGHDFQFSSDEAGRSPDGEYLSTHRVRRRSGFRHAGQPLDANVSVSF
jgi:hypothetical protein